MDTLARERRLISLMTSGMGRLSWWRGRTCWGSSRTLSTFRPGMDTAGAPRAGVVAPEPGVVAREFPLAALAADPFVLPLVSLAPQTGATTGAAFLAPPSWGNSSVDWVSRAAADGAWAFCLPAALADMVGPQADAEPSPSPTAGESCFKSLLGISSTVA